MDSYIATKTGGNSKLGPMMVTTSSRDTCPDSCGLKGNGCYADYGPLGSLWRRLTATVPGERFKHGAGSIRAMPWSELLSAIRSVPQGYLWRHNQAGDLPGNNNRINIRKLKQIVAANRGRRGFTFTHYDICVSHNRKAIQYANENGFTVNISADTLEQADTAARFGVGPVVTVLPIGHSENIKTPEGRTVVVCPNYTHGKTCLECQLCARQRDTIVGFPAHGNGKRRVEIVYKSKKG